MVWKLRRVLSGLAADGNAAPGLELLVDRLQDVPHQRRVPQRNRQATGDVAGREMPRCSRQIGRYTEDSNSTEKHHEDRHPPHVQRHHGPLQLRQHASSPAPLASATCRSSCATSATPSSPASRSWSTPVAASSASTSATASARPSNSLQNFDDDPVLHDRVVSAFWCGWS